MHVTNNEPLFLAGAPVGNGQVEFFNLSVLEFFRNGLRGSLALGHHQKAGSHFVEPVNWEKVPEPSLTSKGRHESFFAMSFVEAEAGRFVKNQKIRMV